jgi:hypothetical protein
VSGLTTKDAIVCTGSILDSATNDMSLFAQHITVYQ